MIDFRPLGEDLLLPLISRLHRTLSATLATIGTSKESGSILSTCTAIGLGLHEILAGNTHECRCVLWPECSGTQEKFNGFLQHQPRNLNHLRLDLFWEPGLLFTIRFGPHTALRLAL